MNIHRAAHLGLCFGVRDAIALARQEAGVRPITILGDLVHNEAVLDDLRRRGVRLERELEAVRTHTVLITAHGTSERRLGEVRARRHRVVEATCPLVRVAHERLAELVRDGFHPVIVGLRDHVEVRGLTGDLESFDVILDDADVDRLEPRTRFGVASQTTQPVGRVQHLVARLRERFPSAEIRVADTVCQPTRLRQQAAEDLAAGSDVVVVVGGFGSNNTRELAATCRRFCDRVHQVQGAADLDPAWFHPEDRVGLTAGTSTPEDVLDAVEHRLRAWADSLAVPGAAPAAVVPGELQPREVL